MIEDTANKICDVVLDFLASSPHGIQAKGEAAVRELARCSSSCPETSSEVSTVGGGAVGSVGRTWCSEM